jgi:prepilin peptidase CpaA
MQPIAVVAIVIAVLAAVVDVRTRRIPNLLTFGAAAVAFAWHLWSGGPSGLMTAALGWCCGVALFFPFFALGGMGAGDVKLLAALGAWLGPALVLWTALFSAMAGGVQAIALCLFYGCTRTVLSNVWLLLIHWRTVGLKPMHELTLPMARGPRLAYAVPMMFGTVVAIWMRGLS